MTRAESKKKIQTLHNVLNIVNNALYDERALTTQEVDALNKTLRDDDQTHSVPHTTMR